MRIHYLQHVPFEGPAGVGDWARRHGHSLSGTRFYNQEVVPDITAFDWLVILGGPMNIYQETEYLWLRREKQLIRDAVDCGKIVLGICLGAQLIAAVLGGAVTKNPAAEIGWLPVTLNAAAFQSPLFQNFPETLTVFQWHNDTFSVLGPGVTCIAASEACDHQAFLYGKRVVGLQFHLESSEASILALLEHCAAELSGGPYVQKEAQIRAGMSYLNSANGLMDDLLDQLAARETLGG